jgi:hypothetical protein
MRRCGRGKKKALHELARSRLAVGSFFRSFVPSFLRSFVRSLAPGSNESAITSHRPEACNSCSFGCTSKRNRRRGETAAGGEEEARATGPAARVEGAVGRGTARQGAAEEEEVVRQGAARSGKER